MGFRNTEDSKREINGIVYYLRKNAEIDGKEFERRAIQTHFVNQGESYLELINKYVMPFYENGDILSISEKIISMCQNNVVEKKDVKVGFWAKLLSKFASSNNRGIAMDEPYKLQLAINLAGLPRILFASLCSAVTKLFGISGVFYKIAGNNIDGIDGFYMKSSFEIYHDLALLTPKEPSRVCDEIQNAFGVNCIIVDANDFGVNILGKCESLKDVPEDFIKSLIKDNPSGQSDEMTPLILIKNVLNNSCGKAYEISNSENTEELSEENTGTENAEVNESESLPSEAL